MNTDNQSTSRPRRGVRFIRRLLLAGFIVTTVYILSFGPISRLTSTVLDGSGGVIRVARQTPFEGWCRWTTVVYRPLLAVEGGQAGRLPRKILSWYVNLWMFGHQP